MFAHDIPEFDPVQYPDATEANSLAALSFLKHLNLPRLNLVTIKPLPEGKSGVITHVHEKGSTTLRPLLEQLSITADANVYFCPNLASGRGVPGEAEVTRLYAMAVDIDPLDTTNDAAWNTERKRIRIIVHDAIHGALPPSYVINTGNGAQLVYFINSIENTPENRVRYLMVIKALSRRVGGDPALTHRVSSLFRVPGTHNVPSQTKRNKGRKAVPGSVWFASERRYDLDDLFAAVAGDAPEPEPERTAASIDGLSFDMLVEAHAKLDPAIETAIRERIERFESFARLHAEVASGKGGEEKNRSKADFRYCVALIEAGMALAAVACALAHYGAQKREMGTANWEKYIIDTVLNAKAEARKPAEEWYDPSGDEDMEQGKTEEPDARRWKTAEQMAERARNVPSPLIKGFLPRTGPALMFGQSNSGKSLVALEMCSCLAAGVPFAGMPVKSSGLCIYLVLEGRGQFSKRVAALRERFKDRDTTRLRFIDNEDFDLFVSDRERTNPHSVHGLVKLLREISKQAECPIDLVVIDVLNSIAGAAEENSVKDMTPVMENIKHVGEVFNCCMLTVHHSGKDQRRGSRGSSVIKTKSDAEIEIIAGTRGGTLKVHKQRDIEHDRDRGIGFYIASIALGRNLEGDEINGGLAIMDEVDQTAYTQPLTELQLRIVAFMRALGKPCSVQQIADATMKSISIIRDAIRGLCRKHYAFEFSKGSTGKHGKPATYKLHNYDDETPPNEDEEEEQTDDEGNNPFA